jgi:hypothetical protein
VPKFAGHLRLDLADAGGRDPKHAGHFVCRERLPVALAAQEFDDLAFTVRERFQNAVKGDGRRRLGRRVGRDGGAVPAGNPAASAVRVYSPASRIVPGRTPAARAGPGRGPAA